MHDADSGRDTDTHAHVDAVRLSMEPEQELRPARVSSPRTARPSVERSRSVGDLPGHAAPPLARAVDDPAWAFELKYDAFRALAFVEPDGVRFVSRNGHAYRQFGPLSLTLRSELPCRSAVLDGEVWLDAR